MKATLNTLLSDEAHNLIVSLTVDKADRAELRKTFARLKDGDVELTVKKYVEKRSLSANAYMWVLCGKIAEKRRTNKDEIYKAAIKEQNIYKVVDINNEAVKTFIHIWQSKGTGWFCEKTETGETRTLLTAYYGSSVYNKRQMSRLIDWLIQDAVALDIDVKTPEEIAKMVALWEVVP